MLRGAGSADTSVLISADAWRRRAVGIFSLASVIAYLPPIAIMVAGIAPPNGWPAQVIVVSAYLSLLFCALAHRTDYRTRAQVLAAAGYMVAVIHLITIPAGPFARVLLAMLPVWAIVLIGVRAGRVATVVSAGFLLFGPFLQRLQGFVEMLTLEPAQAPMATDVVWDQGIGLVALLTGQMILLDRFHGFLMRSLAEVQREATQRAAAYSTLEREMQERRRLEHEVARAGDEERRRLGIDIHDGVCQQLTGALLRCEAMARCRERGEPLKHEAFAALSALLEEAIDESHAVAKGLCPLEPSPEALVAALHALAKRTRRTTGLRCLFASFGEIEVPDVMMANHLYRIAQEALSNAVRHAHATQIDVVLRQGDGRFVLEVSDDGRGIPAEIGAEGMGLRTMAYRTHLLEGEFSVAQLPEGGTRVRCRVPLKAAGLDEPLLAEERNDGN